MPKKIFDIFPPNNTSQENLELEKEVEKPRKKSITKSKKILFLFLSLLIIASVFAYFFLSKAEIEVQPEIKFVNLQEGVLIDTEVNQSDFSNKTLSGIIFEEEIELSQNFTASGKVQKEIPAQGMIRVYNNYRLPQTLVQNTRFQSPVEDICFCLAKNIVIQPKEFVDYEVYSCSCASPGGRSVGGEKYNIKPSIFSVPGLVGTDRYTAIYGQSFEDMKKGFAGEFSQVTEQDIEEAKNDLLKEIKEKGISLLRDRIPAEFIILDDALDYTIIEEEFSAEAGDEVDTFDSKIKASLKVLSFKKFEIEDFIKEFIYSAIGEEMVDESNFWSKEKIQEKSLKIDYIFESMDWEKGKLFLNLEFSANVYPDINKELVRKLVLGRTKKEALTILSNQSHVESVSINFWPFWVNSVPKKEENINIELKL